VVEMEGSKLTPATQSGKEEHGLRRRGRLKAAPGRHEVNTQRGCEEDNEEDEDEVEEDEEEDVVFRFWR
jgi:hypothetical protein